LAAGLWAGGLGDPLACTGKKNLPPGIEKTDQSLESFSIKLSVDIVNYYGKVLTSLLFNVGESGQPQGSGSHLGLTGTQQVAGAPTT
jgi:hypothetical protein